MVVLDAIARRLPGRAGGGVGRGRSFSAELGGGLEYPHYTRPPEFRGWRVPDVLLSGDHGTRRALAEGARTLRESDRPPHRGLPPALRVTIDWLVTILGAILIVLAIKQWVINPYRIPSSSMEPTLNCAQPGEGCLAAGGLFDGSDRVLACRVCYDFCARRSGATSSSSTRRRWPPRRAARAGVFVKRLIGLPGETVVGEGRLRLHRRQEAERALHQPRVPRRPHLHSRRRSRPASTS